MIKQLWQRLDLIQGLRDFLNLLWAACYLAILSLVRPLRAQDMAAKRTLLGFGVLLLVMAVIYGVHIFYFFRLDFEHYFQFMLQERFGYLGEMDPVFVDVQRQAFADMYRNSAYVPILGWFVYLLVLATMMRPFAMRKRQPGSGKSYGHFFLLSTLTLTPLLLNYAWLLLRIANMESTDLLASLQPLSLGTVLLPLLAQDGSILVGNLLVILSPLTVFNLWTLGLAGTLFRRQFGLRYWQIGLLLLLLLPVVAAFSFLSQQ